MITSVFLIVLIAAFAVVVYFTEPTKTDKLIQARLATLDRAGVPSSDEEAGIMKDVSFSSVAAFDEVLRENRLALAIHVLIQQAGLNWTVGRFVFASLMGVFAGAVMGNWWIAPNWIGWLPGLALGAAPTIFLVQKRNYRFHRFTALLPGAIDLMSRSIRAGQALPSTMEVVANEIDEPLRSEFRRAADEQSFGLPFREAMLNLGRRVPVSDLHLLITAILVQKESGGNLVMILEKASYVVRERVRVEGQLRIRTAQGRLTGWVLVALPLALFFIMNLVSPGYGKVLFQSPTGQRWLEYCAVLLVIGVFAIRRVLAVKV